MRLSTRHLRLWSLIVLATMLYGTLVPGLARAFGEVPRAWAEICTPGGTKLVAVDTAADASPEDGVAATREACPFCLSGAHAAVVPVALLVAMPAPSASVRPSIPPPSRRASPRSPAHRRRAADPAPGARLPGARLTLPRAHG